MSDYPGNDTFESAIQQAIPIHGPWVTIVEVYDDDGSPTLLVRCGPDSATRWTTIGLLRAGLLVEENNIKGGWVGDDDE